MEDMEVMFRNLAAITHGSMGGKQDIYRLWKLKRDASPEIAPLTKEEVEEMTSRANKLFAKKKSAK